MTINAISEKTVEGMQKCGLSPVSAWSVYGSVFVKIIKLHEAQGTEEFDREIITNFANEATGRLERKEITRGYYLNIIRSIQRMVEVHDTGKLEWSLPELTTRFKSNEYYAKVQKEYLNYLSLQGKSFKDATWICRKYFAWLIRNDHADLSRVKAPEIQEFLVYCSRHMRSSSVHNVKLYLKKLYAFLHSHNYSTSAYAGLFDFKVSRDSRLFPAASSEEVNDILEIIDKTTAQGKRDYAIIMLGVVTGLRAIDIARLRLGDIDWINGEIKLTQSKTGKSLALPLTEDVGTAIKDYILEVRQETADDTVFLTMRRPYRAFANGNGIGDVYDDYCRKANVPRDAFDGKGFHSLRRRLSKGMVTSGVSVNTVAQVLGDADINSVKKYVSLDSKHLKECALSFDGIAPREVEHESV